MKKIITAVLAICIFSVMIISSFVAEAEIYDGIPAEYDSSRDYISIALSPDNYPACELDENGEYRGIIPELLKIISENSGLDIINIKTKTTTSWKALLTGSQTEIMAGYIFEINTDNDYSADNAELYGPVAVYESDGVNYGVFLGFTEHLSDEHRSLFAGALKDIDKETVDSVVSKAVSEIEPEKNISGMTIIILVCVLIAVIAVFMVMMAIYNPSKKKKDNKSKEQKHIVNRTAFINEYNRLPETVRQIYLIASVVLTTSTDYTKLSQYEKDNIAVYTEGILEKSAASTDIITRYSDDSYLILHMSGSVSTAQNWCENLTEQLSSYMGEQNGKSISIRPHTGVYFLKAEDVSANRSINLARRGSDIALEENIPFVVVDDDIASEYRNDMSLVRNIPKGLDKNEFFCCYTFFVPCSDRKMNIAEISVSWERHPESDTRTRKFTDALEQSGRAEEFDLRLFGRVCEKLEKWNSAGCDISLAMIVSRISMESDCLSEQLGNVMSGYNMDAGNVILELDENIITDNNEVVSANIAELKKAGFKLLLNNFGRKYTSFSSLQKYEMDYIKIDKSLITGIQVSGGKRVYEGIIGFCRSMNKAVICDGVDSEEQLDAVRAAGCDYVNGEVGEGCIDDAGADGFVLKQKQLEE